MTATTKHEHTAALEGLKALEFEPGIQMHWQDIIRRAVDAMTGTAGLIVEPAPTPADDDLEEVEEDELHPVSKEPTGKKVKVKKPKSHAHAHAAKGK